MREFNTQIECDLNIVAGDVYYVSDLPCLVHVCVEYDWIKAQPDVGIMRDYPEITEISAEAVEVFDNGKFHHIPASLSALHTMLKKDFGEGKAYEELLEEKIREHEGR